MGFIHNQISDWQTSEGERGAVALCREKTAWLCIVAVSGCGVCPLITTTLRSLCEKPRGISTALGTGACAKVKRVAEGENGLVVWFLQDHTGFGALWKQEAQFTASPSWVGFSFGKNNFVFVPLLLLKHVELIQ